MIQKNKSIFIFSIILIILTYILNYIRNSFHPEGGDYRPDIILNSLPFDLVIVIAGLFVLPFVISLNWLVYKHFKSSIIPNTTLVDKTKKLILYYSLIFSFVLPINLLADFTFLNTCNKSIIGCDIFGTFIVPNANLTLSFIDIIIILCINISLILRMLGNYTYLFFTLIFLFYLLKQVNIWIKEVPSASNKVLKLFIVTSITGFVFNTLMFTFRYLIVIKDNINIDRIFDTGGDLFNSDLFPFVLLFEILFRVFLQLSAILFPLLLYFTFKSFVFAQLNKIRVLLIISFIFFLIASIDVLQFWLFRFVFNLDLNFIPDNISFFINLAGGIIIFYTYYSFYQNFKGNSQLKTLMTLALISGIYNLVRNFGGHGSTPTTISLAPHLVSDPFIIYYFLGFYFVLAYVNLNEETYDDFKGKLVQSGFISKTGEIFSQDQIFSETLIIYRDAYRKNLESLGLSNLNSTKKDFIKILNHFNNEINDDIINIEINQSMSQFDINSFEKYLSKIATELD